MAERFGMYMEDMRCKVTNDPRELNFGTSVPCSIGFKDKDNNWTNIWVDVLVTQKTDITIPLQKGDSFKCCGRMDCRTWQDKPQWSCWADRVEPLQQQQQTHGVQQMDEAPF